MDIQSEFRSRCNKVGVFEAWVNSSLIRLIKLRCKTGTLGCISIFTPIFFFKNVLLPASLSAALLLWLWICVLSQKNFLSRALLRSYSYQFLIKKRRNFPRCRPAKGTSFLNCICEIHLAKKSTILTGNLAFFFFSLFVMYSICEFSLHTG